MRRTECDGCGAAIPEDDPLAVTLGVTFDNMNWMVDLCAGCGEHERLRVAGRYVRA